ncbi:MAG: hypothetical protein LKE36_06670 [Bacilli bacterium]|jgi:hypothetical protein|nr:hypothetical protein [Bacilli bacterium]
MPDLYQQIIDYVERDLNNYAHNCACLNTSVIVPHYNFNVNYCNERTVAYYISTRLYTILRSVGINAQSIISEFNISLRDPLLPGEIAAAESDSIGADRAYGTWFIPDTYLRLQTGTNQFTDSFIEFKNSDNYKYLSLANDFLKYRFYTFRSIQESLFVFVILNSTDRTPNTPTLLNGISPSPVYQIITPPLSIHVVDPNASVYFINSSSFTKPAIFPYSPSLIKLLDGLLISIDEIINKAQNIEYSSIPNLDGNYYYSRKGKFAPNVIEARIIQNKYRDILGIFDSISQMNDQDIILPAETFIRIQDFRDTSGIDADRFSTEITNYFVNQIRNQLDRIGAAPNKYAFKINRRRALWILLLIDKFSKDNQLGFDLTSDIGSDEEKTDGERLRAILNDAYGNSTYLENFNMLCLGLVFYIVNLYRLIYIIPEHEEDIELSYSTNYIAFNEKKKILRLLTKITASLGIKNTLDWDTDISELGKLVAEKIIRKSYTETTESVE